MARFIEADVIQKIATEAEWLTQTRIPYQGQIMIVGDSSGKVVNIKVGDGVNPFADLNYMFDSIQQNASFVPTISNTLPAPSVEPAFTILGDGDYGSIPADEGNMRIATWDGIVWTVTGTVEMPIQEGTDVLEPELIPKGKAVEGYVHDYIDKKDFLNDIAAVISADGKYIPFIDVNGRSPLVPTEDIIDMIKTTAEDEVSSPLLAMEVKDESGIKKIIPILDANGNLVGLNKSSNVSSIINYLVNKEAGVLDVYSVKRLPNITLNGVAVGRESSSGDNDAPTVNLINDGWTHPSVTYSPAGWNGYPYWMALTPTFGKIAQQTDSAAYENPHIYCSMDGVAWEIPQGLDNPLDTPDPTDTIVGGINHGNSYWSDTDIVIGSDGYMNLYYRGNNMSPQKLNVSSGRNLRAVVHRKIQSPTKIGSKNMIYSTDSVGVDNNSLIASPSFIDCISHWEVYDVVESTASHTYISEGCTSRGVMRRFGSSPTIFDNYNSDNIVNFTSRPWGVDSEVWHLEAHKINGTYILLLNTGPVGLSIANSLWIAYSSDGWTFDVVQTPLFNEQTYRSTMLVKTSNDDLLTLWIYQANTITGEIILNEVKLNYN